MARYINYHLLNWDTYVSSGGGEIHARKIAEVIADIGFICRFNPSSIKDKTDTIVHFFGKPEAHTINAAKILNAERVPFLITPILFPIIGYRRVIHRAICMADPGYSRFAVRRDFFSLANKVVANTLEEAYFYEEIYNVPSKKIEIIPTGADYSEITNEVFFNEYKRKNFILMVGRVTPLKQQLQILNSLRNLKYQVVLIGAPDNNHNEYVSQVDDIFKSRNDWLWIKGLDYNSDLLRSAYSCSKMHILNSKTDVAPLVCIEAIMNRTISLSVDHATVMSMLGKFGMYYSNIRECLMKIDNIYSMNQDIYADLVEAAKKYALDKFSWRQIGESHAKIYNSLHG
jgi:glycosyltransferase involved in cell wall biosynthesis